MPALNFKAEFAELVASGIRRVIDFTRRFGCDELEAVNLFALRATDPRDIRHPWQNGDVDPIGGPENDTRILHAAQHANLLIGAWGALGAIRSRGHQVAKALRQHVDLKLQCLGTTKNGHPLHPLYVPADATLRPWVKR